MQLVLRSVYFYRNTYQYLSYMNVKLLMYSTCSKLFVVCVYTPDIPGYMYLINDSCTVCRVLDPVLVCNVIYTRVNQQYMYVCMLHVANVHNMYRYMYVYSCT